MFEDPFAAEVAALARRLAATPPVARPVVVYGSSTVRLWPDPHAALGRDDVVAVGFGGSRLLDLDRHYDQLVVPLAPSRLVIAAGANDLEKDAIGVDGVVRRVCTLVRRAWRHDDALRVAVLTMKPAPFHRERMGLLKEANQRLAEALGPWRGVALVDSFTPFLDAGGAADPRWYAEDRRHMNEAGYARWSGVVAEWLRSTD